MDRFFMEELKDRCKEIHMDKENIPMITKVIEAYERIIKFSNIGRKEGLLELEEAKNTLDLEDDGESLFFDQISLIVDGTDPKLVEIMGANKYVSTNPQSYLGLISLMYVHGSLMIQAGSNPFVIEQMLKSMMPKIIIEHMNRREDECDIDPNTQGEKTTKELIADLCKDNKEIDEKDHSVVGETSKALLMLSDMDMQRLLRDIDINTLLVAMKGLPGKVRAKIFDNISLRLSGMVAVDITYMGPVRMRDVEKECVNLMKELIKLHDRCEIFDYDFSILKIVIDMYDTAGEENKQLREKYKELKKVIDRIYKY